MVSDARRGGESPSHSPSPSPPSQARSKQNRVARRRERTDEPCPGHERGGGDGRPVPVAPGEPARPAGRGARGAVRGAPGRRPAGAVPPALVPRDPRQGAGLQVYPHQPEAAGGRVAAPGLRGLRAGVHGPGPSPGALALDRPRGGLLQTRGEQPVLHGEPPRRGRRQRDPGARDVGLSLGVAVGELLGGRGISPAPPGTGTGPEQTCPAGSQQTGCRAVLRPGPHVGPLHHPASGQLHPHLPAPHLLLRQRRSKALAGEEIQPRPAAAPHPPGCQGLGAGQGEGRAPSPSPSCPPNPFPYSELHHALRLRLGGTHHSSTNSATWWPRNEPGYKRLDVGDVLPPFPPPSWRLKG